MGGLIILLILIAAGLLVFIIIYNKNAKHKMEAMDSPESIREPAPPPPPATPAPPAQAQAQPYISIYSFDDSRLLSHCPICDGEMPIGSQLCQICGHKMND